MNRTLTVGAFIACALLSGCARKPETARGSSNGAPIILISVDTLRSDHLRFYGSVDPRVELAVVYASQRRPAEMRQVIQDLLKDIPRANAYQKAVKTLSVLGDRGKPRERAGRGMLFPREKGLSKVP